jgi:CSLREA domain-containing protein
MIATKSEHREMRGKALTAGLLLTLMAVCLLLTARPAHAATFTVNSTRDVGDDNSGNGSCFTGTLIPGSGFGLVQECTLRAAIQEANATTAADTINFNIPSTGVNTISVGDQVCCRLPAITEQVTIDGYSQPGSMPNTLASGNNAAPKIELDGTNAGGDAGLILATDGNVIRGLVINRFANGVVIGGTGATGNKIEGNFIGTDASGTQDLGNGIDGVTIWDGAHDNTIGGTEAGAHNIISANNWRGVYISGSDATNNKVMGNHIGTDKNGTADLGNSGNGVLIENAHDNTIGGTEAGARNVISGNGDKGVGVEGANAAGNRVMGNYIGTDASGTQDLGNTMQGVAINSAPDNLVGGTTNAARNVVSGNEHGVTVDGTGATNNKVMGNYIGTDKNGTADLGNTFQGVTIGSADNTVGGSVPEARNVISGNGGNGVVIIGVNANATGNRILSNSIFENTFLGIHLLFGGNNLQNYPDITSVTTSSGQTTIKGTLDSIPNRLFDLQFFGSPTADPSGFGEGQTLVGETLVDTDPNGDASFSSVTATPLGGGQVVSATATDQNGNTSEFSRAVNVVDNTPPDTAPTITPLSPLRKTRTMRPLISAKVSDAQTELSQANMTLFVNNQPKASFAYSQSTDTLTYKSTKLKAGRRHTVRIEANDGVLSTTRSWSFKVIRRR